MNASGDTLAIDVRRRSFGGIDAVVVEWDFAVHGGTFGEREADAFATACADAVRTRTPLVTIVRSGGTRLQEGMRALVGIARTTIALRELAAAAVPHLSVAAHPTTGGVWVSVCAHADLRAGVEGATVGFSGPRVIEAMTGEAVPAGAHTAQSAAAAGLLDAVLDADAVEAWLERGLHALRPGRDLEAAPVATVPTPARHGWEQVRHSRETPRPSGTRLGEALLTGAVALRGADDSVTALVGSLAGRPAVVVAVASERAGRVTPAGYRLLQRAAGLADRLALPLVTLVDTAGADPVPASEDAGLAGAIADALGAVLDCGSATVAVVHGEGGSGGALAAAVCDVVAVTDTGWFAALGPEGAAAALRRGAEEAADLMRVAPEELLADGFADAVAPADAETLRAWLAAALDSAASPGPGARRAARQRRWGAALRSRREVSR